jgi:hypothetical protein
MTYGTIFLTRPLPSRGRKTLAVRAMVLRAGSRWWCGFVDVRSYGEAGCWWHGAVRVALVATSAVRGVDRSYGDAGSDADRSYGDDVGVEGRSYGDDDPLRRERRGKYAWSFLVWRVCC